MQIPASLFNNRTIHRMLTDDPANGVLSCGFLVKNENRSDRNLCFTHYGALLLLSGNGEYLDSSGRSIALSPGAFVQRLPGICHSTIVRGPDKWLEFFICFGRDYYNSMADLGLFSREPVLWPGLTEERVFRCRQLMSRFAALPDTELPTLFLQTQDFAADILRASRKRNNRLLEAAEHLCTASPDYPTPEEAAIFSGISYETFRKQFKDAFGCPPAAYQLRHRLNRSKQLLLDSDLSVRAIAEICRFSDPFAFSKAFRSHYGISPRAFRQSHR